MKERCKTCNEKEAEICLDCLNVSTVNIECGLETQIFFDLSEEEILKIAKECKKVLGDKFVNGDIIKFGKNLGIDHLGQIGYKLFIWSQLAKISRKKTDLKNDIDEKYK